MLSVLHSTGIWQYPSNSLVIAVYIELPGAHEEWGYSYSTGYSTTENIRAAQPIYFVSSSLRGQLAFKKQSPLGHLMVMYRAGLYHKLPFTALTQPIVPLHLIHILPSSQRHVVTLGKLHPLSWHSPVVHMQTHRPCKQLHRDPLQHSQQLILATGIPGIALHSWCCFHPPCTKLWSLIFLQDSLIDSASPSVNGFHVSPLEFQGYPKYGMLWWPRHPTAGWCKIWWNSLPV